MKLAALIVTVGLVFGSFAYAEGLPADEAGAKARIEKSPRHGEYVDIAVPDSKVALRSYVVYPEVKDKAPVVIVIHEIFGLSDWIKGVADQLAAEGFIAIAPDLISGKGPDGGGTDSLKSRDDVVKLIRGLKDEEVVAGLNAVRVYGMKLPSSNGKTGTIGFCWGGMSSFMYAAEQPELNAAVVYYGTSPTTARLEKIKAPVSGHYGGSDNRVNSTIPDAEKKMKELSKTYEPHIYDGAGHGFLRQQSGQNGANQKATEAAWPATVEFLRKNLK